MSASITPQGGRDAPPDALETLTRPRANGPLRTLIAMILVALAFMAVGAQLVRLALPSQSEITSSLSETVSGSYARPDIVDRNGRLLASDVEAYSLFADPARVLDRDEVVEKLASVFPDLDGKRRAQGPLRSQPPLRLDPARAVAAEGAAGARSRTSRPRLSA